MQCIISIILINIIIITFSINLIIIVIIIILNCIAIIFFFTGCTLDTRVLIQNYSRWKVHIFVQVQCFLMTSALAFGLVSATATNKDFMDPGLLVGLIFLGCVATTMSSNVVMTRQAHGNHQQPMHDQLVSQLINRPISQSVNQLVDRLLK